MIREVPQNTRRQRNEDSPIITADAAYPSCPPDDLEDCPELVNRSDERRPSRYRSTSRSWEDLVHQPHDISPAMNRARIAVTRPSSPGDPAVRSSDLRAEDEFILSRNGDNGCMNHLYGQRRFDDRFDQRDFSDSSRSARTLKSQMILKSQLDVSVKNMIVLFR